MNKAQAEGMRAATLTRLERLHRESELYHGESFVRFSPLWRDYLSKQRRRLVKTYHAITAGRYVKD